MHNMHQMNIVCLAKLGWCMGRERERECLWVKTLSNKYGANVLNPLSWKAKASSSNAWRDIVETVPIIMKGMRKLIRNSSSTKFWMDSWLAAEPLYMYIKKLSVCQSYMPLSTIIGMMRGDGSGIV